MGIHILPGLRQDYVFAPPTASARSTEPPTLLPSGPVEASEVFATGGLSWKSVPSALNSHGGQSLPAAVPKQGCQSPKLSRLHQQVTQFKLLKLAQKQGLESIILVLDVFPGKSKVVIKGIDICQKIICPFAKLEFYDSDRVSFTWDGIFTNMSVNVTSDVSLKQHHLEQAGLPLGPACALFKLFETAEAWRSTTTNLQIHRSPTLRQVCTHSQGKCTLTGSSEKLSVIIITYTFCSTQRHSWFFPLIERLLGSGQCCEKSAEVSVCQPLQNPQPSEGAPVCARTCLRFT